MARWETQRGDEWWYRDDSVEAEAFVNRSLRPPVFVISPSSRVAGSLSAAALFRLLHMTRRELPEFELWCSLDKRTEPAIAELARNGRLKWDRVEHPHSCDARILELSQG